MIARAVFANLEAAVLDAAALLLRTHTEWFETGSMTAPQLARELRVTSLRVSVDCRDATVYARHSAFSGHTVEIALSRSGKVTSVMLLG